MTTIAYRDGVLASDSRATIKERVDTDRCKKIFRLRNNSYISIAGDYLNGMRLMERLKQLIKTRKKDQQLYLPNERFKGVSAILVDEEAAWIFDGCLWENLKVYPYYAIGTGGPYALAAMDAGATAEEAVRVGIKRDVYSGGRVQKAEV